MARAATGWFIGSLYARQDREDGEKRQGQDEEHLAPVDVGEPVGDRNNDRRDDEVGRRLPGVMFKAAQNGDDGGHGGSHEGLDQCRQEHCQDNAC